MGPGVGQEAVEQARPVLHGPEAVFHQGGQDQAELAPSAACVLGVGDQAQLPPATAPDTPRRTRQMPIRRQCRTDVETQRKGRFIAVLA